jgi:hypothetical protein
MNAPPVTNPAAAEKKTPVEVPSVEFGNATMAVSAIISLLFTLVFLSGAAYLSYQRNQSFLWAVLHFFFAAFYYPYYAFTQSSPVAAAAPAAETSILPTVQSAGRKLKKMLTGKRK